MSECFWEPKIFERRVKLELDLPNYVTKEDFEDARGVDKSDFAKTTGLKLT